MPVARKEGSTFVVAESDLPFEEEILRNPYSVKGWNRLIDHKLHSKSSKAALNMVYERALKELPGSYKLWYNYLKLRRKQVRAKCVTDPVYDEVNDCFERCLVFLNKMPRIWLDYCQFLMDQKRITQTRRTFDRALRALPITQHSRIWPLYLKFIRMHPIPETALRVYRRYIKLMPENMEDYVDFLKEIGRLDEAAKKLAYMVNRENFVSKHGKSNHQLWHELCDLISKNPDSIKGFNVEAIIRGGLKRFTDQLGQLWCALADYFIRSGHFEKARDIYEEAIQTVLTVRDFGQIFDAYAQFEESMISAKMESTAETGPTEEEDIDLELRMTRFEYLMDRRPLLLNSVLLRQNPHNVYEWQKRVELYEGKDKPKEIINTYTEAVQTIDVRIATGKPHTLWIGFAKFYENHDQIAEARVIFEKAVKVPFKVVDDLASVWCEYAEMELRHENFERSLKLMQRATAMPGKKASYFDDTETVQNRVYKSLKVWSMYADLEESLGTFQSTKAVYQRILDLKIATPQLIMNYGVFLEENNYFEDAFKVYERGVSLFRWPHVYDIWNTYLTKFIKRYGGQKLERIRDLFEQCLSNCPPKFAKALYLLYASVEEEHGLARHAMAVYERATKAVLPQEQFEMYNIYIKCASDAFGVVYTRQIYEKAIESLPDDHAIEMCRRFAELERKLGEIDRARALYSYCSQMCDPRTKSSFWDVWHDFEVKHGNEDTFREMLRIKRSVQAQFNTQVNFMSAQMMASGQMASIGGEVGDMVDDTDEMRELERKARQMAQEAEKDQPRMKKDVLFVRGEASTKEMEEAAKEAAYNPEEINIGDDDEDDEGSEEVVKAPVEVELEKKIIPTEVFGGLADEEGKPTMGAKERLSKRK
ncbi:pre-mRNA-splicing factor SYF1-like [Oscarella lobularis]|uniref:pre-mRNA-splicing factor SYF1-like n=1 Tax=Oscarella lobularis TaxID=121494 RepID=UPI0033140306